MDNTTRYIKNSIPQFAWREARARAIIEGKPVSQWITELIVWAIATKWSNEKLESLGIKDSQKLGSV